MSVPVVSSILGGVAAVGGGIGIYLTHNNKKKDNKNPPQELVDKEVKKLDQGEEKRDDIAENNADETGKNVNKAEEKEVEKIVQKTPRVWSEIIKSDEYKEAQQTGKLLPFVTYDLHEEANNEEKYFLMKIKSHINNKNVSSSDKYVHSIVMKSNTTSFLDLEFDENEVLSCEKLPFYFFSNDNVSSEKDLNLNVLQSCNNVYDALQTQQYVIVFVDGFSDSSSSLYMKKNFIEWQKNKPNINIKLFLENRKNSNPKSIEFDGQMLQIFNKEYPQITIPKQD